MLCRNGLGIGCLIFFGWDVLTFSSVFWGEDSFFWGLRGLPYFFGGFASMGLYRLLGWCW